MIRLGLVLGGVQKAGTTSLFGYLAAHPALRAPDRKELHYFDDEAIDWRSPPPLDGYFGAEDGRIAFEATPISLFWPQALERIRDHNPDLKLIFIFRDPIERAWSHWRMEMERGIEVLPFADAIRRGRERLASRAPDLRALRHFSYVERGYYGAQLERVLRIFARQQILLLRSRDLERSHAGVMARVAAFLGIAPFPPTAPRFDRREADTPAPPAEDVDYLRGLFRNDTWVFAELAGLDVSDWPTMDVTAGLWRPAA